MAGIPKVPMLISEARRILEEKLEGGVTPLILVKAPTSYGKTLFSPYLYGASKRLGMTSSYIHVLPLRALVKEALDSARKGPLKKYLEKVVDGSPENCIGYQAMALSAEGKTPYYTREVIYTTLHSFLLNILRIPVAEPMQKSRHFELPRAFILNSLIVFDEAHLYGGAVAFRVSLEFLLKHRVPIVVESATHTARVSGLIEDVLEGLDAECVALSLGEDSGRKDVCQHKVLKDNGFLRRACFTTWYTSIVEAGEEDLYEAVVREALSHTEKRRRVLVVTNRPEQAVRVARLLKRQGVQAAVLHGRMLTSDREASINRYRGGEAKVLVATQAVEAGVNIGAEAVITLSATPSSLIQRAGRAAREGGPEAWVTIVHTRKLSELGPYARWKSRIASFIEFLHRTVDGNPRAVDWRCGTEKVGPEDMLEYEDDDEEARGAAFELVRIISSPIIGADDVDRVVKDFCDVIGEEMLVFSLHIGEKGEIPINPGQLKMLLDKGVKIEICESSKCRRLYPEELDAGSSSRRSLCRKVWHMLSKGASFRVEAKYYRHGEGLVVE